jgi:hypothetical protein
MTHYLSLSQEWALIIDQFISKLVLAFQAQISSYFKITGLNLMALKNAGQLHLFIQIQPKI